MAIYGGSISGSSLTGSLSYNSLINVPAGIISSSAQLPGGTVSSSGQINYTGLSSIPSGILSSSTQINALTGISSSFTTTASFATTASAATSITFTPTTASFATTASAATSITFTPTTASFATSASWAPIPSSTVSSSYAVTASYAVNSSGGGGSLSGGTTNYIPLWTSATAQSSSAIYQSSGNVGIGTTSPGERLEVAGSMFINGESSGFIIDASGNKRVGLMKYAGLEGALTHGSTTVLRFGRTNQTSVTTGSFTEEMRIDTTGNVGIGTTSPAAKLDVAGTSYFGVNGTDSTIYFRGYNSGLSRFITNNGSSGNYNGLRIDSNVNNNNSLSDWFLDIGGYDNIGRSGTGDTFNVGRKASGGSDTTLFLINSSGNVGIGTTSPGALLHVQGAVSASSYSANGNTVWHAGNDGASSGLDADLLDGNHASAFYLASNPSGYTTNTGTVTSVTVSAGTGMSGGGTVTTSGTITLTNAGVTSAVAGTGITVSGATGAVTITNAGVTSVNGSTGAVTVAATNQTMYIGTTAVAINRSSAALSLTGVNIDGSAGSVDWANISGHRTQTRGDAGISGSQGARSGFFETSSPVNYYTDASSWQHLIEARHTNDSNNYAMQLAGSFFDQALWFRKTNNSPTTAWRRIVTNDTDTTWAINTSGNAANITAYTINQNVGTANSPSFAGLTVDTNTLYVDTTNDRVGIGTTSPGQKLDVTGTTRAPTFYAYGASAASSNILMQANAGASAAYWMTVKTDSTFHIGGNGGSEPTAGAIMINSSGNVGIGTTSPSTTLHVNGSSIIANATTIDPDSYTNTVVAGAINDGSGWGLTAGIGGNAGTGDSWGIGHNGSALYFGMQNGSAANTMQTYMRFDPNRNLYLLESSGNVGIGTTSPSYKLDVVGSTSHIVRVKNNDSSGTGNYAAVNAASDTISAFLTAWGTGGARAGTAWVQTSTNHPLVFGVNDGEVMRITTGNNLGIGTTSPSYKLHTVGDIYANGGWFRVSGTNGIYWESYGGGWYMSDTTWLRTYNANGVWTSGGLLGSNGGLTVGYGGNSPTSMGAIISGSVGIGTQSPGSLLHVQGAISGSSMTLTGTATVQTLVETSTIELKKNIIPLETTTDTLIKLEPSRFEWIDTNEPDVGLIAEHVEEIFPELVRKDLDGKVIGIKYSKLTVYLLKALQEMSERITALEHK